MPLAGAVIGQQAFAQCSLRFLPVLRYLALQPLQQVVGKGGRRSWKSIVVRIPCIVPSIRTPITMYYVGNDTRRVLELLILEQTKHFYYVHWDWTNATETNGWGETNSNPLGRPPPPLPWQPTRAADRVHIPQSEGTCKQIAGCGRRLGKAHHCQGRQCSLQAKPGWDKPWLSRLANVFAVLGRMLCV